MKEKIISAAAAAALALTQSVPAPAAVSAVDDTESVAVKVMCIGDSITDGYGVNGSYRKFLYHGLTEAGYSIDMVGSKTGWSTEYTDEETGETFSYDDDNTGYSGYAIQSYSGRNGIYETLQETGCLSAAPDIVIVQIGTNDVIDCHDIDTSGERLSALITYILGNIPEDSALFVTTIPDLDPNRSEVYDWFGNYRHSADWQTQYSDDEAEANVHAAVDKYNSIVQSTVGQLSQTHPNLHLGDVHSVITDVETQLGDGVHPNNTGYKLMGEYWTGVISEYLSGGSTVTVTSAQTTTTVTTTVTEPVTTVPARTYGSEDIRAVQDYVLGKPDSGITAQNCGDYDLDGNDSIDIFDLILVRQRVGESMNEQG
ncbi:MAG: hypothetical protein IJM44_06850 [Ruminococcus sp.]|nr:hypothetical protein [Ruminococcus sp.]